MNNFFNFQFLQFLTHTWNSCQVKKPNLQIVYKLNEILMNINLTNEVGMLLLVEMSLKVIDYELAMFLLEFWANLCFFSVSNLSLVLDWLVGPTLWLWELMNEISVLLVILHGSLFPTAGRILTPYQLDGCEHLPAPASFTHWLLGFFYRGSWAKTAEEGLYIIAGMVYWCCPKVLSFTCFNSLPAGMGHSVCFLG